MQRRTHLLRLSLLASAATLLAAQHGRAADAASDPIATASTPSTPSSAPAPRGDVAKAERLAEAAFAAYEQQQYERAIELYQRAWAAAPSADIAFNLARVYDRGLQDAPRARDYYQRYIADPRALPHRRRMAELRIAELSRAEPAKAEPPRPEPAASAAEASSPHLATQPVALPVEPSSAWTPRTVTALVLAGAGVSALGLGVGFAVSAHGERNEWQRGCDGNACTSERAVEAARSAGRKADIATVALLSGAGLLGVGAALWWLGPTTDDSTPRAQLRVAPSAHATDLGCTLSGRF